MRIYQHVVLLSRTFSEEVVNKRYHGWGYLGAECATVNYENGTGVQSYIQGGVLVNIAHPPSYFNCFGLSTTPTFPAYTPLLSGTWAA